MNVFATKRIPITQDKKKTTLAVANLCKIDLRPFELIIGNGLKEFV